MDRGAEDAKSSSAVLVIDTVANDLRDPVVARRWVKKAMARMPH